MNKSCARCSKVVYPIEELKCLDKVWHKTCFKCTECNMALNMKTYKGFNKSPYCEAHIPKAKATTIAETPELKRIAENTKIQSNVKYHADFEKSKGKLTQVADDPETLRIRQNTKNISNVAYHGDIQKKAAMERQREITEIVDNRDNNESEYFSETLAAESLPHYQPVPSPLKESPSPTATSPYLSFDATNHANNDGQQQQPHHQQMTSSSVQQHHSNMINNNPKYHQPPNYNNGNMITNGNVPVRNNVVMSASIPSGGVSASSQMQQQLQQKYYDQYENYSRPSPSSNGNNGGVNGNSIHQNGMNHNTSYNGTKGYSGHPQQLTSSYSQQQMAYNNHFSNHQNGGSGVGKIADYDPLTDGPRNIPQAARPNQTLIYSSDRAALSMQNQQRRIGSVNDIDPLNGYYSSAAQEQQYLLQQQQQQQQQQYLEHQQRLAQQSQHQHHQQQQHHQQKVQSQPQNSNHQPQTKSISKVRVYRALYDYEAQDNDEVSFTEGDLIFEVNSIDGGWMTGRVERTGQIGMLPANYIELQMI
ncbi:CLUMA_CG006327, isoform A [Clunio marinus]|uniref:CLUMA_CG006327, isoform A n=1 Tax=Clunio marinus TaxID=568069 RepID=A0A1J1HY46_9DIPT|nr:CLUMA_CG006327, isoform A [Clunio marinus]